MDYTKKIMYQSNSWYNDGLRKAQVRDMSGAIVSLQQSLQYNRENIAARNLLGLVYYGIGEVSEALPIHQQPSRFPGLAASQDLEDL